MFDSRSSGSVSGLHRKAIASPMMHIEKLIIYDSHEEVFVIRYALIGTAMISGINIAAESFENAVVL